MIRFLVASIILMIVFSCFASEVRVLPREQPDGIKTVTLFGEIGPSDEAPFAKAVSEGARRVVLNSPGGSILVADRIAAIVHAYRMSVLILQDNRCDSACVLIFAASPTRAVFPTSIVRVHRVYDVKTLADMPNDTAIIAKTMRRYGVGRSVIQKMTSTRFPAVALVSRPELAEMGVKFEPEGFFIILAK